MRKKTVVLPFFFLEIGIFFALKYQYQKLKDKFSEQFAELYRLEKISEDLFKRTSHIQCFACGNSCPVWIVEKLNEISTPTKKDLKEKEDKIF